VSLECCDHSGNGASIETQLHFFKNGQLRLLLQVDVLDEATLFYFSLVLLHQEVLLASEFLVFVVL
jgi:hypothetical protein